jgi:hypothetical protein
VVVRGYPQDIGIAHRSISINGILGGLLRIFRGKYQDLQDGIFSLPSKPTAANLWRGSHFSITFLFKVQ